MAINLLQNILNHHKILKHGGFIMEKKIVDIELEYFKHKNKEAYETLMKREFQKVVDMLKEPIGKIEKKTEDTKLYCPQKKF